MLQISVIVPIYNTEECLVQCLNSIIKQTHHNIEIILVDDGSTDNSGKICDEFADLDKRIRVFHQANKGVSCARNIGIEAAVGDYICFVDSDDWLEKDYFQEAVEVLAKDSPDILLNNYVFDYEDNKAVRKDEKHEQGLLTVEEALYEITDNRFVRWNAVATFYKRAEFQRYRFDHNICFGEDLLYKFEVIKAVKGKIIYQPLFKYHYCIRKDSACTGYGIDKRVDDLKVFEHVMKSSNQAISDLIYHKEYFPRLIEYTFQTVVGDNEADNNLYEVLVDKIKKSANRALGSKHIRLGRKLKVLLCFLPLDYLKIFIKYYMKFRYFL